MKQKKSTKNLPKLLKFIQKYWITAALLLIILTLIRQNFIINKFPFSLANKQAITNKIIAENKVLEKQNKIKSIELKAQNATDAEVLESQARYRFELIKNGEKYYQINPLNK